MKKYFIVILIIAVISSFVILILNIKPLIKWSSDTFWNYIYEELDKEEKERQKRIKNGEIVAGKDTILIWENMYEIGHFPYDNELTVKTKDVSGDLLYDVKKHKVKEKKLYVVYESGYAVIDKNNLCRVFLTVPEGELLDIYSKDGKKKFTFQIEKVDEEHIIYLSDFNQFTEEERKILNNLSKKR